MLFNGNAPLGVYKNVYWHFSNKVEFNQAKNHAVINQIKLYQIYLEKLILKKKKHMLSVLCLYVE